ncbi:MAG: NCS2 family permease [Actinobacteria bacterium]|nr:NCS2 family permease [Actinomycetota bacterium]
MSALTNYFEIDARGSSVRTEVIGGVTTFMTMAYILFVNPSILGAAGLEFPQVLTVTALVAGVMTILMGVVGKYPFAIAPGLGLNAVVAFTLVGAQGLTPAEAMGVIVTEGIVITILVLTGVREAVLNAIPMVLKKAIGVGIGLFIAIIGFVNAGFTVPGGAIITRGETGSGPVALFVVGLVLALVLLARRVKGALLVAILATTVGGILVNELFLDGSLWAEMPGVGLFPGDIVSAPDFALLGDFSFGYWAKLGALGAILAVFTLMLADFFDTVGTAVGLADEAGFLDEDGRLPGMDRVLLVDSLAAVAGGAGSSSSATTYIESAAGISEGARTGLASVVTGVLFLFALFISPLAGVIPPQATAAALVVVGFLMIASIRDIDWADPTDAAPAFLTLVGMPFTYSITDGIGLGFVSYVLLKAFTGRVAEVHPMMWVSAAAFVVYFAIEPIKGLLGA